MKTVPSAAATESDPPCATVISPVTAIEASVSTEMP